MTAKVAVVPAPSKPPLGEILPAISTGPFVIHADLKVTDPLATDPWAILDNAAVQNPRLIPTSNYSFLTFWAFYVGNNNTTAPIVRAWGLYEKTKQDNREWPEDIASSFSPLSTTATRLLRLANFGLDRITSVADAQGNRVMPLPIPERGTEGATATYTFDLGTTNQLATSSDNLKCSMARTIPTYAAPYLMLPCTQGAVGSTACVLMGVLHS
jgi:hypothetical protein